MASTRTQKMSRLLRDELSRIIREEINDPRLGFISITDVEMTPDLRVAHVHISAYGTPEEQANSMGVLDRASGFLRGELGRQIDIRYIPELRFHLDKSLERGSRVVELLREIEPTLKEDEGTDGQK
ncbi:MAG TPA: 30S ribosome-binding factor RbfA [Armatimonadota bacterium]|nr:30S ribosome-binding factor RbfA [Armatimonadota bacterium]